MRPDGNGIKMSCSEAGGDKRRGLDVCCVGTQARRAQPAWHWVPPGSVGCRTSRTSSSCCRGRPDPGSPGSRGSPRPWEAMLARVGSGHGGSLVRSSTGECPSL